MQIYDAIFSDIHVAVMNSATVKDFKLIVEKKVNEWSNLRWAIDKFLGGFFYRVAYVLLIFSQNTVLKQDLNFDYIMFIH